MTKRIGSIHAVLAAAALAAAPALASPQGEQEGGQQQDPTRQQQGQQQQPQRQQQQEAGKSEKITKKINVDEKVSFPVAGGCQYTANVNGTISPAKEQKKGKQQGQEGGQQQQQAEQHLDADLRVSALVSCPGKATMRVDDTVTRAGPMTRDALEQAIERNAAIQIQEGGQRCAFVPDFELTSEKLNGRGVAYLCATGERRQSGM